MAGQSMVADPSSTADIVLTGIRNRCLMHLLERIAARFNEAGVPLMALKGAALNLTVYGGPSERPMSDLDLLIKPVDIDGACALLEELGCLRGEPLVREDFFPRFHYEIDYAAKAVYPMKIDVHVRPFRPLRYARWVPPDALWDRAESAPIGRATVLIPSAEDMLIHLAVHASVHGHSHPKWLEDIKRWADAHRAEIDWDRFIDTVKAWRLTLPVRQALDIAERRMGSVCSCEVSRKLSRVGVNLRDRLALWQAPRDAAHPIMHVAVNVLCTPGRRFAIGYLLAVLLPGREHMGEWYCRRHRAWLPCAHLLRWCWPVVKHGQRFWSWFTKIEIRRSLVHGSGVFATRDIKAGEIIASCRGRPVDRDGPYVAWRETKAGVERRYEITGKLRFLNHACTPNAELSRFDLVAVRPICAGEEITIYYGDGECTCGRGSRQAQTPSPVKTRSEAA